MDDTDSARSSDGSGVPVGRFHEHCDWPRCSCWCGEGPGTWAHPDGGHHQHWDTHGGNGYPSEPR